MAHLIVSARAPAVVEARPQSNTVVLKVGEALVSFDADEVPQLCQDLSRASLELRRPRRVGMFPARPVELQRGNADLVGVSA
ncbi:hypothetical protein PWP89_13125 [Stenotrophomonas rhizophila]|uniref:hypothetical protein n=1 Tax=Stenotrophomonas rhizophila TaxID=216778 RepID=UPI000B85B45C|nr:hypothetical protein [Stenotrophomonas rhizophila]